MGKVETVETYIKLVEKAIDDALWSRTRLTALEFDILGMAGSRNRILLNGLVNEKTRYLEVGTWMGSTFVAALYQNKPISAIAIDDFSEFGPTSTLKHLDTGEDLVPSAVVLHENCRKSGIKDYIFIENNCFNLTDEQKALIHDINLYFYDGGHTEEDQRKAITDFVDHMADIFILIVDDWNHPPAQTGTGLGLKETGLIIHKGWILPTIDNQNRCWKTWWNGVYIAICEKPKKV
jgi:hypothetical protein